MKKPTFQWQLRAARPRGEPPHTDAMHRAQARRWSEHPRERGFAGWADDPRAEGFEVWGEGASDRESGAASDGARAGEAVPLGEAVFGLRQQWCSPALREAAAPGALELAAMAWLAARGARELAWCETPAGPPQARKAFDVADVTALALAQARAAVGARGDATTAEGSAAARIITLAPSNAEIVAALGAFSRVIACEDSSDHPPEVATRERLGPDLGPDLDRVAALAPDLVLSSLSVPGMERVVTGLAVRGLPQLVLAPRSLDEVLADVQRVGEALGVGAAAADVVAAMTAERAALRALAPTEPVPVYLEWWPRPMFTPGGDCYSNELIALAGGRNVFGGRPGSSVEIRPEELVEAAPAACFVSWCGVSEAKLDVNNLIGRAGLEPLAAARAGHVAALDEALSGRPGPRMLEAARRMRAALVEFGLLDDAGA